VPTVPVPFKTGAETAEPAGRLFVDCGIWAELPDEVEAAPAGVLPVAVVPW
jgi:hypothetical protein